MADAHASVLTYGSAVSFATKPDIAVRRSFLSGTGFSDLRVFVTRQTVTGSVNGSFRNCAWLVLPAEAHSAAAFLQSLLRQRATGRRSGGRRHAFQRRSTVDSTGTSGVDDTPLTEEEFAEELARAEEGLDIERAQNAKQAKQREGTPVRYGQEVQLLHINSGKFVTARPHRLAESNAESLLCELDPDGSDDSHFTILPRYKHRR